MDRRKFLGSVPKLAGCAVAVSFCGRLFGAEKRHRGSGLIKCIDLPGGASAVFPGHCRRLSAREVEQRFGEREVAVTTVVVDEQERLVAVLAHTPQPLVE